VNAKHLAYGIVFVGALIIVRPLRVDADPDPSLSAKGYRTSLVQAMDQCTTAVTNVGGVGACAASNTNTDGARFSLGRIIIKSIEGDRQVQTVLKSSRTSPPAALAGKVIHTEIVLRVTSTSGSVTWVDQTLECPDAAVLSDGKVAQKVSLQSCGLPAPLSDNTTNKEIVSIRVVDSGSGLPIAVPGVRRTH
jgi:hypothetical protein